MPSGPPPAAAGGRAAGDDDAGLLERGLRVVELRGQAEVNESAPSRSARQPTVCLTTLLERRHGLGGLGRVDRRASCSWRRTAPSTTLLSASRATTRETAMLLGSPGAIGDRLLLVGIAAVDVVLRVVEVVELAGLDLGGARPACSVAVPAAPPPRRVALPQLLGLGLASAGAVGLAEGLTSSSMLLSMFELAVTVTVALPGPSMRSSVAWALAAMRRFQAASVERRSAAPSPMPRCRSWRGAGPARW